MTSYCDEQNRNNESGGSVFKAETFGRTAAEALAMNTPVVASAQGGSMDILIDGVNGLLFSPGNFGDLAAKIKLARDYTFTNHREELQSRPHD